MGNEGIWWLGRGVFTLLIFTAVAFIAIKIGVLFVREWRTSGAAEASTFHPKQTFPVVLATNCLWVLRPHEPGLRSRGAPLIRPGTLPSRALLVDGQILDVAKAFAVIEHRHELAFGFDHCCVSWCRQLEIGQVGMALLEQTPCPLALFGILDLDACAAA